MALDFPQPPLTPGTSTFDGRWVWTGTGWALFPWLQLRGGTMSGAIHYANPPAASPTGDDELVNKLYVDTTVATNRFFQGTWEVAANTPDLTALTPAPKQGDYYIAVTANPNTPEIAPATIPGIGGVTITNRDLVYWHDDTSEWELVRSGVSDVRRYATTITGDGAVTNFTINHQLGVTDVSVAVYDLANDQEVITDVGIASATSVTIGFAVAPALGKTFRVVVLG